MIELLGFVFQLSVFLLHLVEEDFHFLIRFYGILVGVGNLDGFHFDVIVFEQLFFVLCIVLSGLLLMDFELFGEGFDLMVVLVFDVHDFGQFGGYGADEDILEGLGGLLTGVILVVVEFCDRGRGYRCC